MMEILHPKQLHKLHTDMLFLLEKVKLKSKKNYIVCMMK